jgi:signal transduction histidine kinase
VVYESIASSTPTTSRSPSTDAELQLFEGFRDCKTALSVPLHTGPTTYGVMVIGSTRQDAFNPTQIELMQTVANQATASLQNAQLYHSLVDERNRIVNIEKLARAKLAGELHDGPTQGVATIAMRVSYIRQLAKRKPEEIGDELYQVEELARRTAKEIRHLLFTLRPVTLESQGLEPALRQLAEKMQETYNQQVEIVFLDNCSDLLDLETATTLFSIVVEAVGNARKHAQAETIWVRAGIQDDTLLVEVEDNGIGFDVEQAMAAARSRAGHLGLVNLQDRAALVEGTLDIQSSPGAGAKVTVSVPMERVRRKRADAPSDVTLDTAGMFG